MTKNENSRKRKRPRNRGPKKNDQQIDQNDHDAQSSKKRKSEEPSNPSGFLDKMRARLSGGHFRMINEKLYTCTGKEALDYFQEDPSLFDLYHAGYKMQMSNWPEQPVNVIINWLKNQSPSLVVADFGCGNALIGKSVKNKVYSLDLVSNDPKVIACDMSNVCPSVYRGSYLRDYVLTPLLSTSVDIAVFCLSLMGTNYANYLKEANRVLKSSGWLLIAEVKSRFDPNTGGADPENFSKAVCELGFHCTKQDFSNKMFILFFFKKKDKQNAKQKEIEWPALKPCLYKRR